MVVVGVTVVRVAGLVFAGVKSVGEAWAGIHVFIGLAPPVQAESIRRKSRTIGKARIGFKDVLVRENPRQL